jgi:glycosyltransferase involved in cell wall biosynthesis
MNNVLLVGQLPPPVNGQTVMIKEFLEGSYQRIQLHPVPMSFSRTIDEVGRFKPRKLMLLFSTWLDIVVGRWRSGANILYYPPCGPMLVPVLRDMFLLIGTRWMFRYTVFHFHAAGLTEIRPRLPGILKPLFNLAYRRADLAIFTAASRASMGEELGAKIVKTVPNGIPDFAAGEIPDRRRRTTSTISILFMGILCEGKGLITLVEACGQLRQRGLNFHVVCGGTWDAASFQKEIETLIEIKGLSDRFSFPGVIRGNEKLKAFKDADIFCFPSHYRAESSPLVLTEAMAFELPIVATNWRGIPDVLGESGGAFLVDTKRPDLVAQYLEELILDPEKRIAMGKLNRAWFCEHGTTEKFRQNMEQAIVEVVAGRDAPSNIATKQRVPPSLAN